MRRFVTPAASRLAAGVLIVALGLSATTCRIADLVNPKNPGTLTLDKLQLLDSAFTGSAAVRTHVVTVSGGVAADPLPWSVRAAQGSAWLKLPALSGTAPGTYSLGLDPAGLAEGVYRDTLIFSVAGAGGDPVPVPVEFRIQACAATDVTPSMSSNDSLTTRDCGAPGRAGTFARLYRFSGNAGDSITVRLTSAAFDGYLLLDTLPGAPPVGQNDACTTGANDPCLRYYRLPRTGTFTVEATSANPAATGIFRIDITTPRSPGAPAALGQLLTDLSTAVGVGGAVDVASLNLRGTVDDPDGDTLRFEVEVRPVGTAFQNAGTGLSGLVPAGTVTTMLVGGLTDDAAYHWQARAVDRTGRASAWTSFGGNAESATDFRVAIPQDPTAPSGASQLASDGVTPVAAGGAVDDGSVVFMATMNDPDPTDQLRLEVEVRPLGTAFTNAASGSSTAVARGAVATATVSGLADNVGYRWQMRAVDQAGRASAWTAFGAGTAADFRVALRPSQLAVTVQPQATAAGAAIAPAVRIAAQDAGGNTLASFSGTVTIALGANPAGATLGGTLTAAAVSGVATFGTLSLDKAGTGFTLVATAGLLSVTSAAFNVTSSTATQLVFTSTPASAVAGAALSPAVTVTARDAFGNVAAGFSGVVTLGLASGPSGATLAGTTTAAASAGVATFPGVNITRAGSGYTLSATASGVTGATSSAFAVQPGAATQLVIVTAPPSGATSGTALSVQPSVQLQDAFGNLVTQSGVAVTATIASGPAGATLTGATATTDAAGLATFATLTLVAPSGSYTLRFGSSGMSDAISGTVTVGAGAPTALQLATAPSAAVQNGAALATQPAIQLLDAAGNAVAQAGVVVTAQIATGGGTLGGTLTATTNASGLATFAGLSITGLAGARTLSFSAPGLGSVASGTITVSAGAAAVIAASAGTGQSAVAGAAVATPPAVLVTDASGNPVAGVAVTFTVTGGGGSRLPTTPVATGANGIAAAAQWTLGTVAGANSLGAAATGLTGSPVVFTATGTVGPAALFTKTSGDNLTGPAGTTLATPLEVTITDANGNPVAGAPVTFAAATGGGSVNPAATTTDASGRATTSRTLGAGAGTQTTTATATILGAPATLTFSATANVGGAAQMSLVGGDNQADTVGATLPQPLAVLVTDALGNPVSGVSVAWTVTGGLGSVLPTTSLTNAQGIATTTWRLGTATSAALSTQSARATAAGSPVNFIATANPGAVSASQSTVTINPATITAATGAPDTTAVTVTARDGFGNAIPGRSVVLAATGSGNSLSQPAGVTSSNGVATGGFASTLAGPHTISAAIGGVTANQTQVVTVTPAAPASLAFVAQPSGAIASGAALGAVQVEVRDAFLNRVTAATSAVTLGLGNNPGAGTLSGTLTVNAAAGLASFGTLSINKAGAGYTLTASSPSLTGVLSGGFDIVPAGASAATSTVTLSSATVASGSGITATFHARDAAGNDLTSGGLAPQIVFTSGGGTSTGTFGSVTDAGNGTYTSVFTGVLAGTATGISATLGGTPLAATPPTVTVVPGPASAATSVAAAFPTGVASGGTSTVTLQAKDAAGNLVGTGGLTVTFTPATASGTSTVTPSTAVTATDNGNGTYSAVFTGVTVGTPLPITPRVNGTIVGTTAPTITVSPGLASPATSIVTASGSTVVSGSTLTVGLQARDAAGNARPSGGETVVFTLSGGGSSATFSPTVDNNDGTYSATLTGGGAGTASLVHATINGASVTTTLPSVTVTPRSQSITFAPPASPAVYGSSFAVAPTATSGLAVGVAASGGCTVTSGTVTMTSGTVDCTLTATQPGDTSYAAATSVVRTVTASRLAASVTPNAAAKSFGAADPAFSGTLAGFLAGDNVTATYARNAGEAVGTYTISATLSPAGVLGNYQITSNTAVFTIGQASQTITFAQPTSPATYGSSFLVAPTATSGLAVTVGASGGCTISSGTVTMTSGTTACVLTASQAGDASYLAAPSVQVTVNAATKAASVTPNAATKVFGASDPAFTGTLTGFLAGDNVTATYSRTAGEAVGAYVISAALSPAGVLGNYSITSNTAAFSITQASQTITFSQPASPATYGTTFPVAPTASSGLAVTVIASGGCSISAGTVTMTSGTAACTLTASQAGDASYLPAPNVQVTVNAATLAASVTPNAATKVFGTSDPAFTGTLSGFLAGDNVTATYARTAGESVGGYTISATLSPSGVLGNYSITSNTAAFTITQASQAITFNALAGATYGDAPITVSATGGASGNPVTFAASPGSVCTASGANGATITIVAVGSCTVTASQAGTADYSAAADVPQSFTVGPKAASVTPNAATKVFGASDPAFTGTLSGFLAGDNVTATYARNAGESVGGYTISATLSPSGVLGNYSITSNTAAFTITQASQAITFNALAGATYGDAPITVSATGGGSGNPVTFAASPSNICTSSGANGATITIVAVGSCTVTASQAGTADYSAAADVPQSFTVGAKAASVTPNAATKVFGASDPAFTGTLSGFLAADNVTATYARNAGESVGSYTISATLSPSGVLGNYSITSNTAAFTITQASQAITFNALAGATYGDAPFTVSATGGGSGNPVTFAASPSNVCTSSGTNGATITIVAVGSCTVTASQAGTADYSAATDVPQSFTVGPKAASVTPDAATKVFGTSDPAFTGTLSGFLAGDNVTATYARNAGESAGSYTISATLSPSGVLGNYSITSNTAAFTITQASQAITFNALAGATYGDAPITVSATGGGSGNPVTFAASPGSVCTAGGTNGATITVVGAGSCTVTASQAGTADYSAAPDVPQSFTVGPKAASVTPDAATKVFGTSDPAFTGTLSGFLAGDNVTATYARTSGESVGSYTISATLSPSGVLGNYSITSNTAAFTITQASQVITFSALAGATFGDPPFTVSATGGGSGNPVTFAASPANVCTSGGTNGATITITGAGSCTVTASQAGTADYSAAADVPQSFTVAQASQSITFAQPASPATFGTTFVVAPTASSGLAVTVLASGGCSITSGTVTMTSGTTDCTLTAQQAGNTDYAAATDVIRTVAAQKASQATLSINVPADDSVDAAGLVATPSGGSGTGAVSYASSTTGICTIDAGTGAITAVSPGVCSLTVSKAADADYLATTSAAGNFNILPGAASQLAFTTQPPASKAAGAQFTVVVTAQDSHGNTATSFNGDVTVATTGGGGGSLFGTVTKTMASGVATYSDLNVHTAGTGYALNATFPGLTTATSTTFDIVAANAHHLAITSQPSSQTAGASIAVTIELRDAFDNLKADFDDNVTISIFGGTGTSGANLGGTLVKSTVGGVVTFSNLTIDSAGTGYRLNADFPFGVQSATSTTFDITPGAAHHLTFDTQPNSTTTAGATMTPPFTVTVRDALGNAVTGYSGTVDLTFAVDPNAGGTPSNLSGGSVSVSNGVATFNAFSIDQAGNGFQLTATAGALTVLSALFDILP